MSAYEPLDLTSLCNTGARLAEGQEDLPCGPITLRGIPFLIGGTAVDADRCAGPGYGAVPHHDVWGRGIFAHTSPIYIACGGEWWMFDAGTAQYMLTLVDGCIHYMRHSSCQHPEGTVTHHHGEDDHMAYLEQPFLQAREAIHRRLHHHSIPH